MSDLETRLKSTIRDIPDFPKPGIIFKDITPILSDASLLQACVDHLAAQFADANIDAVVGMESRGFIFGAPLALALGVDGGLVGLHTGRLLPPDLFEVLLAADVGSHPLVDRDVHGAVVAVEMRVVELVEVLEY